MHSGLEPMDQLERRTFDVRYTRSAEYVIYHVRVCLSSGVYHNDTYTHHTTQRSVCSARCSYRWIPSSRWYTGVRGGPLCKVCRLDLDDHNI